MTQKTRSLGLEIGARVRELRKERYWTQAQLAELLGISQNYLSVLERGKGSFTAEQFLVILGHFNVPVDFFSSRKASIGNQLQNVLARNGAAHLLERTDVIPSERLKEASDAIREALLSAESARQVTALAPVIVAQARNLNLPKIKAQLAEVGVDRRLSWVLDNTLEAISLELGRKLSPESALAYQQAQLLFRDTLRAWKAAGSDWIRKAPEDILDPDIASEKSRDEVRDEASEISKRWRILTRIQVKDFVAALRAARE